MGLRVNHNLDVHAEGFQVVRATGASARGPAGVAPTASRALGRSV